MDQYLDAGTVMNYLEEINVTEYLEQLRDAAFNGAWSCCGYRLEPDAKCPVCNKGLL